MTAEQQKLVTDNMYLVGVVIKKYVREHVEFEMDDIFQNGCYGLCVAAMIFDPSKGKFSTVATRCILNEIQHHMRKAAAKCRDYRKCATTFDQPIDTGAGGDTLGSLIPAVDDVDSITGAKFLLDHIEHAKNIDSRIVTLYIDGFNQPEISRIVGKSRSYISRCLAAARRNVRAYYDMAM